MARVVYYAAASLDGFIAGPDDTIEWLTGYRGSFDGEGAVPMKGSYDRFYDGIGALVMGSVTYGWCVEHLPGWPYAGKRTWVLSSRELPPQEDVRIVNASVRDLYDDVVAAAGERDVWVVGGGNVASQFADEGLLDELIVTVVPVVLGEGKPLFDQRLPGGPMQLLGSHAFDTGMVEVRYDLRAA